METLEVSSDSRFSLRQPPNDMSLPIPIDHEFKDSIDSVILGKLYFHRLKTGFNTPKHITDS